jgi:hypothetical protein
MRLTLQSIGKRARNDFRGDGVATVKRQLTAVRLAQCELIRLNAPLYICTGLGHRLGNFLERNLGPAVCREQPIHFLEPIRELRVAKTAEQRRRHNGLQKVME